MSSHWQPGTEAEGYPRPQLRRDRWISLDGPWDFAIDKNSEWIEPAAVQWNATILVPFSPETKASGIADQGFHSRVWYRRSFERPELQPGERLLLHFGAVDYSATIWVNGEEICSHHGGYTPFQADITETFLAGRLQEVAVRAVDDPSDLAKPRGKQDWKLHPHSIWYPRTTGIWQTVWLEVVPASSIAKIKWTCNLERWEVGMEVRVDTLSRTALNTGFLDANPFNHAHSAAGESTNTSRAHELNLAVRLTVGEQLLAVDTYSVIAGEVNRSIALSDPGIDDYRNELLWSPSSPTLINVALELRDDTGQVLDRVYSYTALRVVAVQGNRFTLNGRPLPLRLVLDQGYWPDSGQTAPNSAALLQDVLLAKKLGFNGVRKHQKIEDPRYLYWADRVGLLVWEEMPSAYRYTRLSIERLTREWLEVLDRDMSHPCIVTWVPFNESWGVPDLPESSAQRNYVQALYHLTKAIDPTRPVIGNDGWEVVATDIIGIHDYDSDPARIGVRYGIDQVEERLFQGERPGGRMLLVGKTSTDQPIVLTEFGGIALGDDGAENAAATWGYTEAATPEQFLERYSALLAVVRVLPTLAGFCYTQFTDTYQEANGLLYADRTPKSPIEEIARATAGEHAQRDLHVETLWKEHIMGQQREVARSQELETGLETRTRYS